MEALDTFSLGGRTFTNVCRFRYPLTTPNQSKVLWFAKDYGAIKSEVQDSAGQRVFGAHHYELVSVENAP